jgi:phosphate:Na+ symporter
MPEMLSMFTVFLAIFLFGMTIMRIGLYNLSHEKLKILLQRFTDNPIKGMFVGIIVTGVLQSSSAVLVLTIGLVATSYITFKQSIGVILGANIGTTFTAELITFNLDAATIPILLVGAALMLQKQRVSFCIGNILFGLGCIFVAMNGFESLASPMASVTFVKEMLEGSNESGLLGIGIGAALTAIIQSSTATTGIIMGFLNEDLLTLTAGTAIILGANIGTCITGLVASIGGNREGRLTAYAHIWLNFLGVIVFYPFIYALVAFGEKLSSLPNVQLAHVSLIFNSLSSLIALPLAGSFAAFILKMHGKTS